MICVLKTDFSQSVRDLKACRTPQPQSNALAYIFSIQLVMQVIITIMPVYIANYVYSFIRAFINICYEKVHSTTKLISYALYGLYRKAYNNNYGRVNLRYSDARVQRIEE